MVAHLQYTRRCVLLCLLRHACVLVWIAIAFQGVFVSTWQFVVGVGCGKMKDLDEANAIKKSAFLNQHSSVKNFCKNRGVLG